MNVLKLVLLFPLIMLLTHNIKIQSLNIKGKEQNHQKLKSQENSAPDIFNLFSIKSTNKKPTFNFFLEENRNVWLRRILNNERKRSVRRNFADFQEIRQNDLIRFHELMVVQNEQMKIIKDKLLRMK
ncbi:hypothetical protein C923_05737 [Plasmodium falciparum UGT5.1]|uniref:Uncharacterized protein n=8 Tax=Plasmodium falciparum TaxID=5833 RepID=C6S3J8_PLAF7|nr:conserved Plasmodium protein, unknown function [Plasmodium falciparum 3D7]ETW15805.1 hypothetical protein PFFVO_05256 [Plasmodium falciparum Vietnam Oak-Knoll (FVO)]ETW39627.1 hypothetical protein PFNF135_05657 [Plasmodium falciparum NF135/5.C10]ETW54280.1 hypothetical protein PFUGPA_04149 [Plasmodium falciparum Palo Alto/Uganda]EWC73585.1 hypothetical protein C923_05737 [Plasmodium falciparum UGT5.1]KAF4329608.1 hypothetical protein CYL21_2800 [Plasmodium falciparum NF54]KOB61465.1 hypoth|eukprot:XP_002585474.1 conserved Plasmodium protein, unknown function [Plasmodium falciparum 3D7]